MAIIWCLMGGEFLQIKKNIYCRHRFSTNDELRYVTKEWLRGSQNHAVNMLTINVCSFVDRLSK